MYCHLRPSTTANLKYFEAPEQQQLIFDRFVYIRFAAPRYVVGMLIVPSFNAGCVNMEVLFSPFVDQIS